MDEDQELSAVFNKTLEYTEKFSFYQNRETIKVVLYFDLYFQSFRALYNLDFHLENLTDLFIL